MGFRARGTPFCGLPLPSRNSSPQDLVLLLQSVELSLLPFPTKDENGNL